MIRTPMCSTLVTKSLAIFFSLIGCLTSSTGRAVEVAADHFRQAAVYVPGTDPDLQAAAQDLVDYTRQMTGADLTITPVKDAATIPNDRRAFVLDSLAVAKGLQVPKTEYGLDGMAYDTSGKLVRLAGETPQSTAFAVADFLERQGVRWYTPGPYGDVVPKRKTLDLPDAPVVQTPSMLSRNPWYDGGAGGANAEDWKQFRDWARRNKAIGGVTVGHGHMWDSVLSANGGRKKLFAEHPGRFGQVDGKRVPEQLCMTNPETVQLFVDFYKKQLKGKPSDTRQIFSICPDDGMIFCTCENCRKFILQRDPIMPNIPDASDLVMHFCNQVIEKLNADYPHVKVCTYIYANFQIGPQKVKVNPHVIAMFAPLSFDRYHYTGDPRSPARMLLAEAVAKFSKQAGPFGWYDYSFLCPDAMMPFTRLHMVSHDLPYLYEKGLRFWTIETARNWPNYMPDYYLTAKLTWDVQLNQKKLLDEFYASYFGPAGPSMRAYIDELMAAYSGLRFSAGNKEFMGSVFTPARLKNLRGLMDQAIAAAQTDATISHRVKMFELMLRQGERYMAMRDATNRCDFQQAERLNEEVINGFGNAIEFDRLTICEFVRDYWYMTYYGKNVKQVAAWTKDAAILHRFPDQWPAVLDAKDGPEPSQYPLELKTYSACLAEQGYETFRGTIWYRQTFAAPALPAGKRLFLLIAGFDDNLTAWVDGQAIGKAASGSFGPALLEITKIDTGKHDHTLVLRITNKGISELGTGGLLRPVCLIARDADR